MKESKITKEMKEKKQTEIVETSKISLRGRKFEGYVIRKFPGRVAIQFERVKLIKKYERYIKLRSKMHARLPENMKDQINIGDYIQIQECRPLSKIIHHIVIKKIRDSKVLKQ